MTDFRYRPDIDGLRAVAVLGVLFFHAGLGCSGGFVGVDVFFVISGFLITSLILRDLREETFSFVEFWARRIRRIVPALAVVTLVVIIVGYFGMFPEYYEALGKQVIALVLCVSNVKFWRETGYFDTASDEKPLLHTWSLSVEEQFYFIIPIALFLVFKFRREGLALPLIILTCIGSFVASVYASYHYPSANFYLLPTRAWELGAGSLLAFARPIASLKLREVLSFIGLTLILGCYYSLTKDVSFPGVSAVPPVLGATLLIWSGIGQTKLPAIGRFLTLKPIVGIGLISYSLYLWHWPLFAYQKHLGYSIDFKTTQIILLLISFAPAYLSWKFVETPFRKKALFKSRKSIYLFGGNVALLTLVFGLFLSETGGFLSRFPKAFQKTTMLSQQDKTLSQGDTDELALLEENLTTKKLGNWNKTVPTSFAVWGDSHARAMGHLFHEEALKLGLKGCFYGGAGVLPFRGERNYLQSIEDDLKSRRPRVVFLIVRWACRVEGATTHEIEDGKSRFNGLIRKNSALSDSAFDEAPKIFDATLSDTINILTSVGIKIVIVKDIPEQLTHVRNSYLSNFCYNYPEILPLRRSKELIGVEKSYFLKRTKRVNAIIDSIAAGSFNKVATVDAAEPFFGKAKTSLISDSLGSFYSDADHISCHGADKLLREKVNFWLLKYCMK